jgi:hypothetical protein
METSGGAPYPASSIKDEEQEHDRGPEGRGATHASSPRQRWLPASRTAREGGPGGGRWGRLAGWSSQPCGVPEPGTGDTQGPTERLEGHRRSGEQERQSGSKSGSELWRPKKERGEELRGWGALLWLRKIRRRHHKQRQRRRRVEESCWWVAARRYGRSPPVLLCRYGREALGLFLQHLVRVFIVFSFAHAYRVANSAAHICANLATLS